MPILLALLTALGGGGRALADPVAEGVGVYGRFDHEIALSAGVGGGARLAAAGDAQALGSAEVRAHFLHTAGLALGASFAPDQARTVSGSLAVDLRPLFLISLFENRFVGDSFLDLMRDGLGLEAGISWDGEQPAFLLGLGTELPLARHRDSGLFVRLGARLVFARTGWVGGEDAGTAVELGALLQAHTGASAGIL